jgi:hypothetical protein
MTAPLTGSLLADAQPTLAGQPGKEPQVPSSGTPKALYLRRDCQRLYKREHIRWTVLNIFWTTPHSL